MNTHITAATIHLEKDGNVLVNIGLNPRDNCITDNVIKITHVMINYEGVNHYHKFMEPITPVNGEGFKLLNRRLFMIDDRIDIDDNVTLSILLRITVNIDDGSYVIINNLCNRDIVKGLLMDFELMTQEFDDNKPLQLAYVEKNNDVEQPFDWKGFAIFWMIINLITLLVLLTNAFTTFVLKI